MGASGELVKASAAIARNMLGSVATINGVSVGKSLVALLNPAQAREALGDDWSDQQSLEWARIEIDPAHSVKAGDGIVITANSRSYIVNRVTRPVVDDVVISNLCLCVVKM